MGAWGAIIMSFFGAVFAALTLNVGWGVSGAADVAPFALFAVIGMASGFVLRLPGPGITPSEMASRVIMWSSIAEGVGLFIAANLVTNLHHSEYLLPAMALIVGLHFLPIAWAAAFTPFYALGAGLLVSSLAGFALGAPAGGEIAGAASAVCLWIAAILAVVRDWRARTGPGQTGPRPDRPQARQTAGRTGRSGMTSAAATDSLADSDSAARACGPGGRCRHRERGEG